MLTEYQRRRDQVIAWLAEEPRLRCAVPQGAFYLFPDVSDFLSPDGWRTSLDFADAPAASDEHVVTTAGEAFDAPGFLRLSYATSLDRLREGVTRLIRFVDGALPTVPAHAGTEVGNAPTADLRLHEGRNCGKSPVPLIRIVGADFVTDRRCRARARTARTR